LPHVLLIEVATDENELIVAGIVPPFAIRLAVKEHMNTLKDEATGLAREADEALHPEDVHPPFTEQLAKPHIEPVGIDVALMLDGDRAHFVVVLMLCDPGALDLMRDGHTVCVPQLEIEFIRGVLGVEADPRLLINLQDERLAPR